MNNNKISLKFKLAAAAVAAGSVLSLGTIVWAAAHQQSRSYDEITAKCSQNGGETAQTFRNVMVSPQELFPTWPVARPITVTERDTGRVTQLSGNNCAIFPKNPRS